MHPHILIGLLGHDITDRLLAILDAGAQGDVNIELDRWSRAVKQAAERIRYDSQLEVHGTSVGSGFGTFAVQRVATICLWEAL